MDSLRKVSQKGMTYETLFNLIFLFQKGSFMTRILLGFINLPCYLFHSKKAEVGLPSRHYSLTVSVPTTHRKLREGQVL